MTINADLIDRLGAAALDAREAVREAHAARKDLRTAMGEARTVVAGLVEEALTASIELRVKEIDLQKVGDGLKKALADWLEVLDEAKEVLGEMRVRNEQDKATAL